MLPPAASGTHPGDTFPTQAAAIATPRSGYYHPSKRLLPPLEAVITTPRSGYYHPSERLNVGKVAICYWETFSLT